MKDITIFVLRLDLFRDWGVQGRERYIDDDGPPTSPVHLITSQTPVDWQLLRTLFSKVSEKPGTPTPTYYSHYLLPDTHLFITHDSVTQSHPFPQKFHRKKKRYSFGTVSSDFSGDEFRSLFFRIFTSVVRSLRLYPSQTGYPDLETKVEGSLWSYVIDTLSRQRLSRRKGNSERSISKH